jgi:adenine-specific DNA-methyltransferase
MPTLHWIGKEKVINHHLDVPFRVLEHKYTEPLTPKGEQELRLYPSPLERLGEVGNKIIHGDNLEALKALLPEYEGRVKCIYIDPPYNTGNEGWVYNDNVNDPKMKKWLGTVVGKEAEDLTRHDKWLCMMYPRLRLLHKLLAEDGAIFISIDDNEQANLKLICDEIFGGGNYLCSFVWEKRYAAPPDVKDIGYLHENILFYRKTSLFKRNLLEKTVDQLGRYKNPDNDPRGAWKAMDYTCRYTKEERPNLFYSINQPNINELIFPKTSRVWAYSQEQHLKNEQELRIWWGKNGKNSVPALKNFLSETADGAVPVTLLKHEIVGHTDEAAKELRKILPNVKHTPKPARLIQHLIKISSNSEDIILDAFAGSGTTAHAVLNMNKADGGNRKFILIEMEDYAETITAERVKRVINGYANTEGTGGSFDYYELGEALFLEDGNLNEAVGVEKIRGYIWYTETQSSDKLLLISDKLESPSYLGKHNDTAYYFYYEPEAITTLDHEFLATMKTRAEQYIVYADNCLLTKQFMTKHHIIFKKIPRDVRRF